MKFRPLMTVALLLALLPLSGRSQGAGTQAAAAVRAEGSGETHLRYEVYWGGFHAANFVLSLRNGGGGYENEFQLATRGIADWFLRLRVRAESRGAAKSAAEKWPATEKGPVTEEDGVFAPILYTVDYTNRRRQRRVRVRFEAGDAIPTIRTKGATAEEDREKEGKVPEDFRRDVIDPLTALAEIFQRTGLHLNGGPEKFRLNVYDGRRRFDLEAEYRGRMRRTVLGHSHDVHQVRVFVRAVAGFKDRHRKLWNDSVFDLFLTTDGRFLPVQIMAVGFGPVINLIEECARTCRLEAE